MDLTHVSSVRNCMSSPSVMGICRDIPILITISGDKLSDIAVWDGQARNERMQPLAVLPGHVTAVVHLYISRDSKWLFSVSDDMWLLWQLQYCLDKEFVQVPQSLSKVDNESVCNGGLMISCFSPCNNSLFVSTVGRVCIINTKTGLCSEIDSQLLCPNGAWTILSAAYCNSCCIAVGLEDRTFKIYNLEAHEIIYQSSVFPVTFTSIDCTKSFLTLGTNTDGTVKMFSLPGLLDRSCDTILHTVNHSCDQQSYDQLSCDQTDVDHDNVSVLGMYMFEDEELQTNELTSGVFLLLVIRRCGVTFINGFNRSILGELRAGDSIPSLVDPQEPTFIIPAIYNASIIRISENEFVCSLSGLFDEVISLVKIVMTNNESVQTLSVTSSIPLVADSILLTPSSRSTPQQHKISHKLKQDKQTRKTTSIRDQPLTFKNKIKSSGYTQQPRMAMFSPSTNIKQKYAATGTTVMTKKTFSVSDKISGAIEPCCYDNMYRSHSYLLHEKQPIKHCLFTGDGSHLVYNVTKTLYTMRLHPFPSPLSQHRPFDGHDADITGISGSHDNQWVLTCSSDKTAKIWRVNPITQQPILNISTTIHNYKQSSNNTTTSNNRDNTVFPGPVNHCSFYYLDKFILLSYNNIISLLKYNLDTDKCQDIKRYLTKSHYKRVSLMSLDPAVKSVTSLSCINDFYSYLIYVAGSDRSLHVYDMNLMKWVWSVQDAHKRPINCIAQNKGSKFIKGTSHDLFVTSSISDGIKLWDTRTQRCVRWYTSHHNQSQPLTSSFSPCGRYIATGSEDRMIYLYDTRMLAPVEKLVCKTSIVSTVQYHPFKPMIVCGTLEGELNFFEK